jgi:toxin ParE1/3/4
VKFRVIPEANAEAASAAAWYEDQRAGLGDDFLGEVQAAYERIQANPNLIPRMERYRGPHLFRRCLLSRFPYHAVFACSDEELVVIAIAHNRRKPFYWLNRL